MRPVALCDPAAREPDVVGFKAALLAGAAVHGLPVLPGCALPLGDSAPAIAAGARVVEERGPSAAYLAATETSLHERTSDALAEVSPHVVVRSSTPFDADGRWAGAFASYLDIARPDLAAAVRGCWASPFSRDALARCRATGLWVGDVRIGVLVQPWVPFDAGGTARVLDDDRVSVSVARGGPHGVVLGVAASMVEVDVDGRLLSGLPDDLAQPARAAARLVRRAADVTGIGAIEWGSCGEAVNLLQVGPAPTHAETTSIGERRGPTVVPSSLVVPAVMAGWFPGRVGETLVLPWAVGLPEPPWADPVRVSDARAARAEARAAAVILTEQVWRTEPSRGEALLRDLRAGRYERAADALRGRSVPDRTLGRRVVGLVRGLGETLTSRGVLAVPEVVWHLSEGELDAAVEGIPPLPHRGPGRWEPFVVDVAMSRGRITRGAPVADGVGAGRLHRVDTLRAIGRPGPRAVLVAPLPLPQLAPLLWHAAGLVTADGSEGAHLLEVARSLAVPAVFGVDTSRLGDDGAVIAVDGASGEVATLPVSATERSS